MEIIDEREPSCMKEVHVSYVQLDIQGLHALLNSESIDESALTKDIDDVLSHWSELFFDGKSIKVTAGLRQFGKALDQLLKILGGGGGPSSFEKVKSSAA
jgi:hypothetical protein